MEYLLNATLTASLQRTSTYLGLLHNVVCCGLLLYQLNQNIIVYILE